MKGKNFRVKMYFRKRFGNEWGKKGSETMARTVGIGYQDFETVRLYHKKPPGSTPSRRRLPFPAFSRPGPPFFRKMLLLLPFHNGPVTRPDPFREGTFAHYPQSCPHCYVNRGFGEKISLPPRRVRRGLPPLPGKKFPPVFSFSVDKRGKFLYDNRRR